MAELEKEQLDLEQDQVEEEKKTEKKQKKKKTKLEDQLDHIQEELEVFKDKYFRNLAEMENYKKRMSEDLKKERKYSSMPLADKLIDTVEVFDQALNMETDDNNLKNFLYGFRMIKDMIFNALKDEGVTLIESKVGDDFDPNIHEAMDTDFNEEKPENSILRIVKKGYKFKDRVLRPTMVVINIRSKDENEDDVEENIEEKDK